MERPAQEAGDDKGVEDRRWGRSRWMGHRAGARGGITVMSEGLGRSRSTGRERRVSLRDRGRPRLREPVGEGPEVG